MTPRELFELSTDPTRGRRLLDLIENGGAVCRGRPARRRRVVARLVVPPAPRHVNGQIETGLRRE
jgi:hypothetical protein